MLQIEGIHHISAITGDARRTVDFYTGVLGLRLIAKSVNQDDPRVYHLFFGEEQARPGADMTFFEYPRATPGRAGAGMVHRIVWRVGSGAALEFWHDRLTSAEVHGVSRTKHSVLFADAEGLSHELVVNTSGDTPLVAEHPEIAPEVRLQGFEGVRAYSRNRRGSDAMLRDFLGAAQQPDGAWELRGSQRGGWIAFDEAPDHAPNQSAGTVHHIAFGVHDDDYDTWASALDEAGIHNSGPIDRTYFEALYFREPGGILYELSTQGPGFTVDGPVEQLGTRVSLPPWLEENRAEIEAELTPLPNPRAEWVQAPHV